MVCGEADSAGSINLRANITVKEISHIGIPCLVIRLLIHLCISNDRLIISSSLVRKMLSYREEIIHMIETKKEKEYLDYGIRFQT